MKRGVQTEFSEMVKLSVLAALTLHAYKLPLSVSFKGHHIKKRRQHVS